MFSGVLMLLIYRFKMGNINLDEFSKDNDYIWSAGRICPSKEDCPWVPFFIGRKMRMLLIDQILSLLFIFDIGY